MIRNAQASHHAAVRAVVEDAFGAHGPQVVHMVDALDAAGDTAVSLVAEDAAEVVGHVQLSRGWVDARERLVEVLVLSPLAVRPDRQGQGVGTALVQAAIVAATQHGAPAVFLEGDPGYYGSRRFEAAGRRGFTRPSVRIPEAAFQVALLPAHEPWMTGALVYPQAFWVTDCVGLR